MKLYIKNMVSQSCIFMVQNELKKLGIEDASVQLGVVEIEQQIDEKTQKLFSEEILKCGLEVLVSKKSILVNNIKNLIIDLVHHKVEIPNVKYSVYISQKLDHNYTYLSNLFNEISGKTIEQYIISHKIERVKELLFYDELNLSEISYQLNYSSVAHLSSQFKKTTGHTPSYFKQHKENARIALEDI